MVRISDGGCNPHWAARLYLSGSARHKAVRRLVKPDKIPADLPFGRLREQDALPARHGHFPQADLALGFDEWYSRAGSTWQALLGTATKNSKHRFRWEAATGMLACPDAGASNDTAALRATIRRTVEAARLRKGAAPRTAL